ncbi:MAG: AraC family transcriptional regulator [Lentisphaeraceae bacterium]|nr:AraC family transcriptional regulator [Lentisphaeraceae bacterium]
MGILKEINCQSLLKMFDRQPGLVLWIKDKHGVYEHANQEFLRHYFLKYEDVVGCTDFDLSPVYIAEAFLEDDAQVLQGEEIYNRLELINFKDQRVDWFMTTKLPLRNILGEIIATIGMTRRVDDIAEPEKPEGPILEVMDYIKDNFHQSVSVKEMAGICCLSLSAFERKFKKHFKMTPTEYVMKFRVNQVCRALIYTQKPISEIALENGFCDHSYLTRKFKKIMGISPKDFRKKN